MSAPADPETRPRLELYGGRWAALIPAVVLIAVMCILSIAERAAVPAFWVGGFAALVAGLMLARNRTKYAETVVRGMSDRTGAVVILAFIFAGIFGEIMKAAGLVDGLLWLGLQTGLTGAWFTVLTFLLACVFGAGTGTSVGTVLAMVPVLYPAGVFLGADPTMLAIALIAGGAFGDNLAPVSDTTITSAYTQDAKMGDVVRSRLPLALTAAAVSVVVFAFTGGGGTVQESTITNEAAPIGLLQIIPFVLVIVLAMRGRHIITSLTWGILGAIAIGLATSGISPGEVFSIPPDRDTSTGLIQDGIGSVTGVVMLVLLIMALAQVLAESGLMAAVLERLERASARGVRSAELTIIAITVLFTVPLGANAPAILLVGTTIGKPLGMQFNLSGPRRANLLDCSACSVLHAALAQRGDRVVLHRGGHCHPVRAAVPGHHRSIPEPVCVGAAGGDRRVGDHRVEPFLQHDPRAGGHTMSGGDHACAAGVSGLSASG